MEKKIALSKLQTMCSRKEYCIFEIKQKLKKWKVEENDIEDIIISLTDSDFINENRFSNAFVNDKFKFNKWGKNKIRYELFAKKIPQEIISIALDNINEEEYNATLKSLLTTKLLKISNLHENAKKQKLFNFGQSKGYEIDLILKIFNKIS